MLIACHYVFSVSAATEYIHMKMSGSIPLAFSTGSKLILSQAVIDEYNCSSCLAWETVSELSIPTRSELNHVFKEAKEWWLRRDAAYDAIILAILNRKEKAD